MKCRTEAPTEPAAPTTFRVGFVLSSPSSGSDRKGGRMNLEERQPCERCGIPRSVRGGGNRSTFCRDCKQGHSNRDGVRRDWIDDAACTQVDPEIFFPSTEDNWQPTRDAKRICAGCPVAAQCLADTPAWDRWSVRGGKTGTERRGRNAA